ncbi:MAG TPA: LysR substrate-binding domain-containing protein [Usitatibacter sp.]|nr:LysR substrate-binding domain-containing protein [Usitatibacter sp.]
MANPHRELPPLDLLRGFEAAARHLSFTKAAAELFLTQSAVSRQVQALEEFLGARLFERRHKALALTAEGQAFLRGVALALDGVREATRRLRDSRGGHVLTVTTTVSFASMWLVPRIARWRKAHPRVDVRVTATHDVVDMERLGIDVAIRDCALDRVPAGAVHLVSEHLAAVCSPGYAKEARAAGRPLRRPADLRHHLLLNFHDPAGRFPWLSWAAWLEATGVEELEPSGTLAFDQYDQVLQAALHGQGVALGRMSLSEDYIRQGRLVALFGPPRNVGRGFHAIVAPRAQDRPEAREFVEWVRRELRREAA